MRTFAELMAAARSGSPEAISELYDGYGQRVMGAIRKRLGPALRRHYDTLDLAHSVFADVIRDLGRVRDQGEDAFRHWLYLKVENKVRDKLRKHLGTEGDRAPQQIESARDVASRDPSPSTSALRLEEKDSAMRALRTLDDRSRALVLLRVEEGLPFAEIAEQLDLPSPDSARMRFARAMAELRARWTTE